MKKGTLGIRLSFYTVLAFTLAAMGWSTALFILSAVVLLVEKDEWANRQVIQAIVLALTQSVVSTVLSFLSFFYDIPIIGRAWSTVHSAITTIVSVLVFALCIVAVIKNLRDEDAAIPVASKIADWAYGVVAEKKAAPAPAQTAAPAEAAPAEKTEE